jgi:phosphatidylinositol alpha-mannosyltransferase
VLLAAVHDLPDDVRVWVGGDGPQGAELRSRYRFDPRIEWLGRISDDERAARMRGCTVYCSPSVRGESFGMVLLEAMASGAALVASDLDGHRNVATDGLDALLAPVGDAEALAKALRRVLEDEGLRAELVAGGHRRAEQLSMGHLADRYLEIYDGLLAERPAPRRWRRTRGDTPGR